LARAIALKNTSEFRPVFALLDELGTLGQDLLEHGMDVTVIGRQPGIDFDCARRLRRLFRQEDVAVVHAHQYGPLLYSALARLPRLPVPILFTEHGRDHPDYRRWKRVWANRLLLTRQDRFIAVGDSVRQALIDYEGLPEHRIEVIYNGCDLSQYDPRRSLRSMVRSELGLEKDEFVVIQVARLNRLKDLPTAIRATKLLASEHPVARLVIVGEGEDRPQLERLTEELQLEKRVLFLGSRPDVTRLLQSADAFMLSSISEGIPLTLIEAMASGLPCVATRVGGVPEVIRDGETGLLIGAGDPVGLAAQLGRLLSSPGLRQRLGKSGHRYVLERHDASMMHRQYLDLYRHMLLEPAGESSLGLKSP
jgi:glycosyltransferase involved in cell wall biosynthesis